MTGVYNATIEQKLADRIGIQKATKVTGTSTQIHKKEESLCKKGVCMKIGAIAALILLIL